MTGVVLSLADRQPVDVQRRAAVACALLHQDHVRPTLDEILRGPVERGIVVHPTLDEWYRAQPVPKGRISPKLTMLPVEKRLYGLSSVARLVDLKGMGAEVDHWTIAVLSIVRGYVVGVKAPIGGGGVGVMWTKARNANDYALRLSVEHDMPIREVWA